MNTWDTVIKPGTLKVSPQQLTNLLDFLHKEMGGEAGKALAACVAVGAAIADQIMKLDEETYLGACKDTFQHPPTLFAEADDA